MLAEFHAALADDLLQLIRLHDRELDMPTVDALKGDAFPTGLALLPDDACGRLAWENMRVAVASIDAAALDLLAADYAAIYLNNALGASPYESVWLSDEHLACDRPMFELRERYAAAGWQVADWRRRFDDHLVLQLQYIERQLRQPAVDGKALAAFIDEHIGYWFPDFAQRIALRCATPFYAALVELSHVWLKRFRELLADMHGCPVPERAVLQAKIQKKLALEKAAIAPVRFMPGGQGPSW